MNAIWKPFFHNVMKTAVRLSNGVLALGVTCKLPWSVLWFLKIELTGDCLVLKSVLHGDRIVARQTLWMAGY